MIQKIIQHILFPIDCIRTGSRDILRYQEEYEKSQFLTRQQLDELSFSRMKIDAGICLQPYRVLQDTVLMNTGSRIHRNVSSQAILI